MSISTLICGECLKLAPRTGPGQKFCAACSEVRDLKRKRLWARSHKPNSDVLRRQYSKSRSGMRAAGAKASADAARSMDWLQDGPDLLWMCRVKVPFDYSVSKNHIYSTTRNGHIFLRAEQRQMREIIEAVVKQALRDQRIAQNKLWIDLLVQKTNHKGDAINVVDCIADALKTAIGLDDRWFCIRRLDWEIVKESPFIFIGFGQDTDIDAQVCSMCGQIKPFTEFNKNRSNKCGISRECRQCKTSGRHKASRFDDKANPRAEVTVEGRVFNGEANGNKQN
jgi:hypothetical protein